MDPVEMARERAPALLSPHASPELLADVASISAERHSEGYRLAALASSNVDTRDVHPQIRVPTLVLWGEYDGVTSRQEAEQLRDAIPGAKLVVIPGAGHVSNQEQPALFNAAVRQFLADVQPETVERRSASKAT
jgi:pimeloyl-ACP methyl ester carboxylesterase